MPTEGVKIRGTQDRCAESKTNRASAKSASLAKATTIRPALNAATQSFMRVRQRKLLSGPRSRAIISFQNLTIHIRIGPLISAFFSVTDFDNHDFKSLMSGPIL